MLRVLKRRTIARLRYRRLYWSVSRQTAAPFVATCRLHSAQTLERFQEETMDGSSKTDTNVKMLAKDLLKQESLVRFSQQAMHDVLRVVRHYTASGEAIEDCLPRELLSILDKIVLPSMETTVPSHALQALMEAVLLTLREQARYAASPQKQPSLTLQDAHRARNFLQKLQSIRIYHTTQQESSLKHSLTMALNHVLQLYAELASANARQDDLAKRAVQGAEHLLIDVGTWQHQHDVEWLLQPDVVSFHTVMGAWARSCSGVSAKTKQPQALAAAERAQAILDLLLEIYHPTARSYEAVLPAWSHVHSPIAAQRAMDLLQDMVERHQLQPQQHPVPTERTLVLVCGALSQDPHRLEQNVAHLLRVRQDYYDTPVSTILLNAILNAHAKAKPKSPQTYHDLCQNMIRLFDASDGTAPDRVTFQTILSSLAVCVQRLGKTKSNMVDTCCQQAHRYLDMAAEFVDVHMVNDVLMASRFDVKRCEALFERTKESSLTDATSWRCMMDAYEQASRPKDASNARKAEDHLLAMESMDNRCLRPDTTVYNGAIAAWIATRTTEGVQSADAILSRLCKRYQDRLLALRQDPNEFFVAERPNTTSFLTVMKGFANQTKNVGRVEALLQQMEDLQLARAQAPPAMAKKMAPVEPNVIVYNTVLDLYAKKGMVREAEDLLKRMESVLVAKQPDTFSYQAVLKAYGVGGAPAAKTIKLLDLAKKVDRRDGSSIVNTRLYNSALNAIVKGNRTVDGAELAEALFSEMSQPDCVSRSTLMKAWTQTGSKQGIERAERILQDFCAISPSLPPKARVDTVCFNTVLSALDEKTKALALLEQMHQLSVKPDTFTYNCILPLLSPQEASDLLQEMLERRTVNQWSFSTVVRAWFRANNASEAQGVLRLMRQHHHTPPCTIDYNSVMKLWGLEGRPERAEALLEEMEEPDHVSYHTAMAGYFTQGTVEAAQAATNILTRMEERFTKNNKIKPDRASYSICMDAWMVSKAADADERMEDLLRRYKTFADDSENVHLCNLVLQACVQRGSASRGIRVFTEWLPLADHRSFAHVFCLCGKEERVLEKVVRQCQKSGQLSSFALGTFLRVAPASLARKVLNTPKNPTNVTIDKLDPHWSRFVT